MYYNLIDNKFGCWVGVFIVFYIVLVMILVFINFVIYIYYFFCLGKVFLFILKYDDIRFEIVCINVVSIFFKYLNNGYFEVFFLYNFGSDDKFIEVLCLGLIFVKNMGVKI